MKTYAKAIVATSTALAVAVTLTTDGAVSLNDGIAIAAAWFGALAVYFTPNADA